MRTSQQSGHLLAIVPFLRHPLTSGHLTVYIIETHFHDSTVVICCLYSSRNWESWATVVLPLVSLKVMLQ